MKKAILVFTTSLFIIPFVSNAQTQGQPSPSTAPKIDTTKPFLKQIWQSASTTFSGTPNSFYAQFISPTPTTALIDLELFDQDGKQVAQKSWDNVLVNPQGSISGSSTPALYKLTGPSRLSPGVYTWKAATFSPGWKEKYNWYDSAAHFYVVSSTTISFNDDITPSGMWQQQATTTEGNPNYISIDFQNGTKSGGVNLMFAVIDSKGHIIDSKIFNDVYYGPGYTTGKAMHTSTALKPGTYHWAVGIFSTDNIKMYGWYVTDTTFTVIPSQS